LKNKKEIESKFQNLDIQFSIPPNELPKLTIKFWDFPIKRILSATTAEKLSYARLLHSRLDDLVSENHILGRILKSVPILFLRDRINHFERRMNNEQ